MNYVTKLKCTVWNNGGNGWGIRIGKERNQLDREKKQLKIKLAENMVTLPLTETFWSTCPEIRSKAIRDYFFENGINKKNKSSFWIYLQEDITGIWKVTIVPK